MHHRLNCLHPPLLPRSPSPSGIVPSQVLVQPVTRGNHSNRALGEQLLNVGGAYYLDPAVTLRSAMRALHVLRSVLGAAAAIVACYLACNPACNDAEYAYALKRWRCVVLTAYLPLGQSGASRSLQLS